MSAPSVEPSEFGERLTNPHSCCRPCNRHAMASALRFLPSLKSACQAPSHFQGPARWCALSRRASCSCWASISISLIIMSACCPDAASPPLTLSITSLAAETLPTLTSQRGVSGIKTTTAACRAAGKAPSPTIHRQPVPSSAYVDSSHPITYATICPMVMNSTFIVTSRPRCDAGATSAMYSGTTKLAAPTPAPTMHRPATMTRTDEQTACSKAPTMKRTSA